MARRPGPPTLVLSDRLVGGGGGPEEPGQLAGAGDGHDGVRLAAGLHRLVDLEQALLGAVADRKDVFGLAGLAIDQGGAQPRRAAVMPRGLDEQPAGQQRAGLRDRALP